MPAASADLLGHSLAPPGREAAGNPKLSPVHGFGEVGVGVRVGMRRLDTEIERARSLVRHGCLHLRPPYLAPDEPE